MPPGTPTRDFPDGTILPGLINAHVHLTFDAVSPPGDSVEAYPGDGDMLDAMAPRAEGLLRSGVTTARDLGDRGGLGIKMREQVASGQRVGPRLLAAAVPLTPPGGHCWFLGGEVTGEADIRAQVRRLALAGADVIKLMASGGATTEGKYAMADCQFTTAEIAGAVEEAHGHGLPVAAHAHGAERIARAVDAGVDSIEHGTWVTSDWGWDRRSDVAVQMAEQGTVLCAASPNDREFFARIGGDAWAHEMTSRVAWFEQHGVTQTLGTDAGTSISPFTDTPAALARFLENGISSPESAIEIGTVAAARALGLGTVTGALRPGLAADLLIVDGNPLNDLGCLERTCAVVARGSWYDVAT